MKANQSFFAILSVIAVCIFSQMASAMMKDGPLPEVTFLNQSDDAVVIFIRPFHINLNEARNQDLFQQLTLRAGATSETYISQAWIGAWIMTKTGRYRLSADAGGIELHTLAADGRYKPYKSAKGNTVDVIFNNHHDVDLLVKWTGLTAFDQLLH